MPPQLEHPCARALTFNCFKSYPAWAKQAFAARLVHLLAPPQISRKLQKILRPALIAPGVTLPPGIALPPGVVVTPDAVFPPGWTEGDTLPPGAIQDPAVIAGDLPEGAAPSTYVAPFEPGPVHPGIGVTPPPGDNWEAQFDNTHWERYFLGTQPNWDGSKWVISSNDSVDITVIGTWHAAYRPTKIRVTIDPAASTLQWLNLMDSDHNPIAYLEPYTNLAEVDITFITLDIFHLSFFDSNDGINITNIEFLP